MTEFSSVAEASGAEAEKRKRGSFLFPVETAVTHTLFPDSAICPNHAEKGRSERAYASKKIISISGHR
jgi:hypothetical protein